MSQLVLIIPGIICGLIMSKIINKSGDDVWLDLVLGVIGALAAGWLLRTAGMSDVGGVNVSSLAVAIFGAMGFLIAYHRLIRHVR